MNRSRHVKYVTLNIGGICVGDIYCIISRWEEKCSNTCFCYNFLGQWENDDKNNNIIVPVTTVKNWKFRRNQRKKKYIT